MRRPVSVGLVYRPTGTPGADRSWARSLVVRHAYREGLDLLDVLELDDDQVRNAGVLERVRSLSDAGAASLLITDGVDLEFASDLARSMDLHHRPVRLAVRRPSLEEPSSATD
jgi:phosphoserine phosphatase